LNRFRPDVLHGYGSYLERLFPELHQSRRPFHKPKVVIYGADMLSPAVRNLITQDFGIPVFSTYQAIEAFKIGFECSAHSGLHLNIDLYPLRIVDGQGNPAKIGEPGEVVVSNLVNRGTVLLNYRLGDVAALLPAPCSCGRTLPLMSFVRGRSNEWLTLTDRPPLHSQIVSGFFRDEARIWQHQVRQLAPARFRVSIVAAHDADRAAIDKRLREKFLRSCGQQIDLQIEFVDEIERTAAGKLRTVLGGGAR
jgi:phenylacetate-CoA ligase